MGITSLHAPDHLVLAFPVALEKTERLLRDGHVVPALVVEGFSVGSPHRIEVAPYDVGEGLARLRLGESPGVVGAVVIGDVDGPLCRHPPADAGDAQQHGADKKGV